MKVLAQYPVVFTVRAPYNPSRRISAFEWTADAEDEIEIYARRNDYRNNRGYIWIRHED